MYTETEEWTNEQPDGGIVYGITVRLYDDDGTYLGAHQRHWHLDVDPPTREEVETTRQRAVQHVNERAEEMRRRAQARRERKRNRLDRHQRAEEALEALRSTEVGGARSMKASGPALPKGSETPAPFGTTDGSF